MTRKRSIILLTASMAAIVLAAAGAIFGAPYWSMHQLKTAAQERDVDALMARVDLNALRQSVRLSMGFRFSEALHEARAEGGKPLAEGARAAMAAQVDPLTETLVSPPLLIAMLIEGRPSRALTGAGPAGVQLAVAQAGALAARDGWHAQLHRVDSATVQVRARESPQAGGFVLKRTGLLDWKLSGLLLPDS